MNLLAVTVQDLSFNSKDVGYIIGLLAVAGSAWLKIQLANAKMILQISILGDSLKRSDDLFEKRDKEVNDRIDKTKEQNSKSYDKLEGKIDDLRKEVKTDTQEILKAVNNLNRK